MFKNIVAVFLISFFVFFILNAGLSFAAPNNLSQKYLGDLDEESYNKFFNDTLFFSSVERALIQKAIAGKVEEAQETLKLEERRQKEILDPDTFVIEKRDKQGGSSYRPRSPIQKSTPQSSYRPQSKQQPQKEPVKDDSRNFTVNQEQQTQAKVEIPQQRLIVCSGVIFRKKNDWVVWLNGQKVTPDNYLPEIIEIEVENSSYVHLKWYDIGLQDVISVTLRPNQVYDITTGVLLPG